jgi:ribokinase
MAGKPAAAFLGDINVDVFLNVHTYPVPGGDAFASSVRLHTGGSVTNSAVLLSRLGIPTRLFSRTGADAWAASALADLTREGIDLQYVTTDPQHGTGLIFIPVTPDGERTMFSYRGANVQMEAEHLTEAMFAGVGLLHLSGYSILTSPQKECAYRALELVRSQQGLVTLDLGVEPAEQGAALDPVLAGLDLLVLGSQEVEILTGTPDMERGLENLFSRGVRLVGLKLGKEGCLLASPQERARVQGLKVRVVDTTGAGDAFSAGLIYAMLSGLSLGAAAAAANAFGALAATVWGGGVSLPSRSEMLTFLHSLLGDAWLEEAVDSLEGG